MPSSGMGLGMGEAATRARRRVARSMAGGEGGEERGEEEGWTKDYKHAAGWSADGTTGSGHRDPCNGPHSLTLPPRQDFSQRNALLTHPIVRNARRSPARGAVASEHTFAAIPALQ
jgi:hypothetical protein